MNWEAIGAIGELLGAAGVIATLGYLAFQIRQNTKQLGQEAQRTRAQAVRESWAAIGAHAELMVKDFDGEKLDAVEAVKMQAMWMVPLFGYQTSFLQLPRHEIEPMATVFRRFFETQQSIRTAWAQNRAAFHPDFIRFMEETVINVNE